MTDNTYGTNGTYDYDRYYGKTVVDTTGEKVGDVGQVYLDDQSGRPEWVTVRTGLFGLKETFVPLQGETFDGDTIVVPFTKDQIKGAPAIDPEGHISEDEEAELYNYYGRSQQRTADVYTDRTVAGVDTDRTVAGDVREDRLAAERDLTAERDVKHDDNLTDGVVAHEERLNVGTEQVETGRVRIRKHVVTETQTVQVPVTREEIHVERTPIADGEKVGDVELAEGEQEIVLHEERPVVSKETVATERVNVSTEKVTENQAVSANLAKERIEVDTDAVDGKGLRDELRDDLK